MTWSGIEPATSRSQVRRANHSATLPLSMYVTDLIILCPYFLNFRTKHYVPLLQHQVRAFRAAFRLLFLQQKRENPNRHPPTLRRSISVKMMMMMMKSGNLGGDLTLPLPQSG
ncbi:hypothetical protein ElyMa_005854900 [Elysia marginata]|uniref:Uncharacterized protein n=1 Tax=Elysia marginata TaxID=1093978 RepID=A0AAV4G1U4_9GAST|nr:hypothetical protein ElyMa_005854900 [Elysia marginata]